LWDWDIALSNDVKGSVKTKTVKIIFIIGTVCFAQDLVGCTRHRKKPFTLTMAIMVTLFPGIGYVRLGTHHIAATPVESIGIRPFRICLVAGVALLQGAMLSHFRYLYVPPVKL